MTKSNTLIKLGGLLMAMTTVHLASAQALDPTKTQMALPLPEAPVIDGVLGDGEWSFAGGAAQNFWRVVFDGDQDDLFRGGGPGDGNPLEPFDETDLQYNIYAGIHGNDLYIAVEVTDDWINTDGPEPESENGQTWTDDSVEIFIDGDNSNFEERSTNGAPEVIDTGGQFVITANNAYRQAEAGDPGYGPNAAWYARTDLTDNGYVAEFRISMDIIGNPEPGTAIGFTVGVNDDDEIGDEGSERQILWVGIPHTEITYGNLIIGERTYVAPKAPSPTVDGEVSPEEYAGAEMIDLNMHTGSYHIGVGNDEWEEGDHSLQAWAVHDDDAVYIGIIAVDDTISTDSAAAGSEDGQTWIDDSIEVFFDANDSNDQGRDQASLYEGQYVLTANGARRDNEANNPTWGENAHWFGAAKETPSGYQIEFKITKEALLGVEDGARMGFNIAMNDDDGDGRKSQLNWAGNPHLEFSYGAIVLGPAAGDPGMGGGSQTLAIEANGNELSISWEGGGNLYAAPAVTGPWSEISGASSPHSVTGNDAAQFYTIGQGGQTVAVFLNGSQEVPAVASNGKGAGTLSVNGTTLTVNISYSGLESNFAAAHIHGPAERGSNAGVLVPLSTPDLHTADGPTAGTFSGTVEISAETAKAILEGRTYVNIHTSGNGAGEIRGQTIP